MVLPGMFLMPDTRLLRPPVPPPESSVPDTPPPPPPVSSSTTSLQSMTSKHGRSNNGPSVKTVRVLTQTHHSSEIEPSLYPTCCKILARLSRSNELRPYIQACKLAYDEFRDDVLTVCPDLHSAATMTTAQAAISEVSANIHVKPYLASIGSIPLNMDLDPVSLLWSFFRMGSSLCALFNLLDCPKRITTTIITDDIKLAKRAVYEFVNACKQELGLSDDNLFTISNVFSDNTTDLLKVLKTVEILINELEKLGKISPARDNDIPHDISAIDKRSKVVEELVTTERRYVQDMEELCRYQIMLQSNPNVSQDIVHGLFPNLHQLIDFQRRILVAFEYQSQLDAEHQRFGSTFEILQDGFSVYEGFALNQKNACDIAVTEIERMKMQPSVFDFSFDLGSTLIKPIQRICKYPLLLSQLLKSTPEEWEESRQELEDGLETIKYITTEVNETQRRVENSEIVRDLMDQIKDWRGHNVEDFGELLHDGKFTVVKSDIEREYHLYLFEHIILCCKPIPTTKKNKKSSTASFNGSQVSLNATNSSKKEPLALKGRIYLAYITDIVSSRAGGYTLHISWGRDRSNDTGYFDIIFRHEEVLNQWESTIRRLLARFDDTEYAQYTTQPQYAGVTNHQNRMNSRQSFGESDDDLSPTSVAGSNFSPVSPISNQTASVSSQYVAAFNSLVQEVGGLDGKLEGDGLKTKLSDHSLLTTANVTTPYSRNRAASTPGNVGNNSTDINTPRPAARIKSEGPGLASMQSTARPVVTTASAAQKIRSFGSQDSSSSSSSSVTSKSMSGSFSSLGGGVERTHSAATSVLTNNSTMSFASKSGSTIVGSMNSSATSLGTTQTAVAKPQMKVRLRLQEDTFLLLVPEDIKYPQLLERIERKIRLCGKQTGNPMKIRYKDEDDDFVTMNSDEDIQMALEMDQEGGQDSAKIGKNLLTLWVE